MKKDVLLKRLLARVGDPQAKSVEFKDLAWSLFIETVVSTISELSLPEKKAIEVVQDFTHQTDARGIWRHTPNWWIISDLSGVAINSLGQLMPVSPISEREYQAIMSNDFYVPSISASEAGFLVMGQEIIVVTGILSAYVTVRVFATTSIYHALRTIGDTDPIPIHDSTIYLVMPVVVEKLKAEVGLIL